MGHDGPRGISGPAGWIDSITPGRYETIVISSRGITNANIEELSDRVRHLGSIAPTLIFGPIQFYEPNMPTVYSTMVGQQTHAEVVRALNSALQSEPVERDRLMKERLGNIEGVTYVSLLDLTCPGGECNHFDANGWPMLIDNSHMSSTASRQLLSVVKRTIDLPLRSELRQ